MLRITGGFLGGRRIAAPPGGAVRPTQQRVREALFSILASRIAGGVFLDLFAGSGIVGLEAWSRGAAEVTMVDHDARDCAAIRRQAQALRVAGDGLGNPRVVCADVGGYLRRLAREPGACLYDLVYADPPYEKGNAGGWEDRLGSLLAAAGLPAPGGFWIMERRASVRVPSPVLWTVADERDYGGTRLTFYRRDEARRGEHVI